MDPCQQSCRAERAAPEGWRQTRACSWTSALCEMMRLRSWSASGPELPLRLPTACCAAAGLHPASSAEPGGAGETWLPGLQPGPAPSDLLYLQGLSSLGRVCMKPQPAVRCPASRGQTVQQEGRDIVVRSLAATGASALSGLAQHADAWALCLHSSTGLQLGQLASLVSAADDRRRLLLLSGWSALLLTAYIQAGRIRAQLFTAKASHALQASSCTEQPGVQLISWKDGAPLDSVLPSSLSRMDLSIRILQVPGPRRQSTRNQSMIEDSTARTTLKSARVPRPDKICT